MFRPTDSRAQERSNRIGSAKWPPMRWRRKKVHSVPSVCIDSLGNDRSVVSALEIFSTCSELKRVIVASPPLRAGSRDRNMGVVAVYAQDDGCVFGESEGVLRIYSWRTPSLKTPQSLDPEDSLQCTKRCFCLPPPSQTSPEASGTARH